MSRSSGTSAFEGLLHGHRLGAGAGVVGGVVAGANGRAGGSGGELGLDEVADRAGLLGQGVQVRSNGLVGLVGQLGGLLSDNLGVVGHGSVNFVLVLDVQERHGEGQDDGDDGKGVQGQVGGDKVQDVRDTGSLQGQLNVLGVHNTLDLGLGASSKSANGRQDGVIDEFGVGWSVGSVLGDKALASDQFAHILGGSGDQEAKVRSVEDVVDHVDLEEHKAEQEATKHLSCGDRVLPGKQAAEAGGRSIGCGLVGHRGGLGGVGGAVEVKRLLWRRHWKEKGGGEGRENRTEENQEQAGAASPSMSEVASLCIWWRGQKRGIYDFLTTGRFLIFGYFIFHGNCPVRRGQWPVLFG